MPQLLHASYSGFFPFCIIGGNSGLSTNSGIVKPIDIASAMSIYWNIGSLSYSFSLSASFEFLFYPFYPLTIDPITIQNTVEINDAGPYSRGVQLQDPLKLVCYNKEYLNWLSPQAVGKKIGTATEYDVTNNDGPYSYDIFCLGASLAFLGFPENNTQAIKRVSGNLYDCGVTFEYLISSQIGTGQISTNQSIGDHSFQSGLFSAPFFGSTPLYWNISDYDTGQFQFIDGSAAGSFSVSITGLHSWGS